MVPKVSIASHPTGDRRLWLLGLRSPLGIMLQWKWEGPSISPKELLPILFAVAMWGEHWGGRLMECHCDNMAVVAVVNSGQSQYIDASTAVLVPYGSALPSAYLSNSHPRSGQHNAADALSHGDLPRFLQVVPEAASQSVPIPQQLVDLLVREQPDWTSPPWAQLFRDCFRQVWPPPHSVPTHQERRRT